jgi:Cache domain
MKVRRQLVLWVGALLVPLVLLTCGFHRVLADVQHDLQKQRMLERVRALRLAFDTEIDATKRTLRWLAQSPSLGGQAPLNLAEQQGAMRGFLQQQPNWLALIVLEPDGRELARLDRKPTQPVPALDPRTRQRVVQTQAAGVSNWVAATKPGDGVTFVAVPVLRSRGVVQIVAVAIDLRQWLSLLRSHPVGEGVSLTLTDQEGRVLAHTPQAQGALQRNSPMAFGRPFPSQTEHPQPEGSFIGADSQGERTYWAYSRLGNARWTLGTGVAAKAVEAPLRSQVRLGVVSVLSALLLALVLAGTGTLLLRVLENGGWTRQRGANGGVALSPKS